MVATRNARPSWPTIELRKEVDISGQGHCFLLTTQRHLIPCESCYTLAYPAYVHSLISLMVLLIFQAKLEELQAEKESVVSEKDAADDGNRKLVSGSRFFCLLNS